MTAALVRRPPPPDAVDAARWEYSGRVYEILDGDWLPLAAERLSEMFHRDVLPFLPRPDVSNNPLLSITSQKCILYDQAPTVDAGEGVDLTPIITPRLWPLCQERLLLAEGTNEALIRVDLDDDGAIQYRVVPAHHVTAEAHADRPDVPVKICETRWRTSPGPRGPVGEWTVETWDTSDPTAPLFRVEAVNAEGVRVDRTAYYVGAEGWPERYIDRAGLPILPYVLHHARIGNHLWRPLRGREVVEGTLTVSTLMTMWLAGFRDGAYPQRHGLDVEPMGAGKPSGNGGSAPQYVTANPMTVILFRSQGQRSGSLGQFAPAMDPKSAGEAIQAYIAQLAIYADLSPSDVSLQGGAQSGYQVVVSRDGLRRAQRRQIPGALLCDRQILVTAARLHNALHDGNLPESLDAYQIRYHQIPPSLEEIRASLEEDTTLMEAGLRHPVDVYLRHNPHRTRDEAIRDLVEIARARALLARAAQGLPPERADDDPDAETGGA